MATGAEHDPIAALDADDPNAALRALQFQHWKDGTGADVPVPHFQRQAIDGERSQMLGPLSFQRLASPITLGPRPPTACRVCAISAAAVSWRESLS